MYARSAAAPDRVPSDRRWSFDDCADVSLNFLQEFEAEAGVFLFVIKRRIVQFPFSEFMKRDSLHQRSFARARRSTLVADLPRSFDESHELSRLSASSAQIISFSSSDKFSRLSKSLPAKRARSLGTSFRTAASISFMLIRGLYSERSSFRRRSNIY